MRHRQSSVTRGLDGSRLRSHRLRPSVHPRGQADVEFGIPLINHRHAALYVDANDSADGVLAKELKTGRQRHLHTLSRDSDSRPDRDDHAATALADDRRPEALCTTIVPALREWARPAEPDLGAMRGASF